MSFGARRISLFLAIAAMAGYCAIHLQIGTDITNFMPDGGRAKLASLSRKLANSELTRTMTISIGSNDLDTAVAAASALADRIRDHPEIDWIRSSMPDDLLGAAVDLYFPRRFYLASASPERDLPAVLSEAGLERRARQMLGELRQPTSTFFKPMAMRDPLGLFRRFLDEARRAQPTLPMHRGHLVSRDADAALIMLGTVHSHFASDVQAGFLEDLDAAIESTSANYGVTIEKSGANRIAVAAEKSIKRDIYRIGACTLIGVAALFLLFFRSLYAFLLVMTPALFGVAVATTAGILVLGNLDGLTIAFGTALMGVAVDYSIHVLNHYNLSGTAETTDATVARLRPSLILGAGTTMASFAGLLMTTSPAFRELGFFSIVGIGAAVVATLVFLPALVGHREAVPALAQQVAERLGRAVRAFEQRRGLLRSLTAIAFAVGLLLLPRLQWVDDLSRLGNADPDLIAEDVRVRSRLPNFDTGRFVIAIADDSEAALQKNDRIYGELSALQAHGEIGTIRSLHQFLPSTQLQQRNLAVMQNDPTLPARVDRTFAAAGFRRGSFDEAFDDLRKPPSPLTIDLLADSPLGSLLATMAFPLDDEYAVVTYLQGVGSNAAVRAAISGIDGAVLFEQRAFVDQVYGEFRATTLRQILVGTVLVALVLLLRYRALRPSTAAILPSLLVIVVLLGSFAGFGVETNFLHLIALMMVMGMGVDYGVFLVDSYGQGEALGATMLSLLISCLTTVLVFGTLAISEHPALRAIGVTTGAGVLLAFLFAPISLLVTRGAES